MLCRKTANVFAVLTLGLGVGFLTYFGVYNESRSNYVGYPGSAQYSDPYSYRMRVSELEFISTVSGFGAGLVAVSAATFVLIAKGARDRAPKGPLPEV